MQALLELDCFPAGMELFPAANDDQLTWIKKVIDDCDYYLLIVGGRYGSTNEDGISYTQLEFEYAMSRGKPIISFVAKNPGDIPSKKTEQTEKGKKLLNDFLTVVQRRLVKYWESPAELGAVVSRSMIQLIRQHPAEGWVKASSVVDTEATKEISRLQKEYAKLKTENEELMEQIKKYYAPANTEELSQGEEIYSVPFEYFHGRSSRGIPSTLDYSWNQLFRYLGPFLTNECTEDFMRVEFQTKLLSDLKKIPGIESRGAIGSVSLNIMEFQVILNQFKALGYAEMGESGSKGERKWRITEYGDLYLVREAAIKKNNRIT